MFLDSQKQSISAANHTKRTKTFISCPNVTADEGKKLKKLSLFQLLFIGEVISYLKYLCRVTRILAQPFLLILNNCFCFFIVLSKI